MKTFLLVGLGGVLGAMARHALSTVVPKRRGIHTLTVNVLGSIALGYLVGSSLDDAWLLLFATGFCGAFTTFSTFAVEVVRSVESGERRQAVGASIANLAGALLGIGCGLVLARLVG